MPGDVIVFDPRVHHGSWGGTTRLRWSIDFLAMPADDDSTGRSRTASLVRTLSGWPTTEGFPTWAEWQTGSTERRKAAVNRLRHLGVDLST